MLSTLRVISIFQREIEETEVILLISEIAKMKETAAIVDNITNI